MVLSYYKDDEMNGDKTVGYVCVCVFVRECNFLLGKHGGQRPLVRSRHRPEEIKLNHRETGQENVHWIHLAQHKDLWSALTITAINFGIP
jgi:hypothetical protein